MAKRPIRLPVLITMPAITTLPSPTETSEAIIALDRSVTAEEYLELRGAMLRIVDVLSDLETTMLERRDFVGRVVHSAARTIIKKLILPLGDPVVRKVVHGVELHLPLSHDLPRYVGQYPYYDTILPNLAKFLLKYEVGERKLVFVDVGANVGDTARLVSAKTGKDRISFICIEADEIYLPLLWQNTQDLSITVHNVIAASRTEDLDGSFVRDHAGTSSIIPGKERRRAVALDELISNQNIDIIKIDTDGYEAQVLSGLSLTLARTDPLIFLEYSPRHLVRFGKTEPIKVLEILGTAGYRYAIIYDNRGHPMGFSELTSQAIHNLTAYCLVVPGFYTDLLLTKDPDLLLRFYDWDLNRYLGNRRTTGPEC
jgi:FkbM family methyltransferase